VRGIEKLGRGAQKLALPKFHTETAPYHVFLRTRCPFGDHFAPISKEVSFGAI